MPKSVCLIKFRLIQTPCCSTLLCFVNPRLPNYCSECGARIFMLLKQHPEHILVTDDNAQLSVDKAVFDVRGEML